MNRPLVYEVPHKAIRNALSQLSLSAGSTDYNSKDEMKKLKSIGDDVFMILKKHAEHEDNVTLKYLEEKRPGASSFDKEDHVRIESEMYKLEMELNELYENAGKDRDQNFSGNDFYIQVSDFHAQYLQHMLEEERQTQPLIWEYFTDEEIHLQEIEIRSSIPPDEMLIWSKYMMPAFSLNTRVGMLKQIKEMAPPEFFKDLMKTTESVLSKDDYKQLKKAL